MSNFVTITQIGATRHKVTVSGERSIIFSGTEEHRYTTPPVTEFFINGSYTVDDTPEKVTITVSGGGSYHCEECEEWCPDCEYSKAIIQ